MHDVTTTVDTYLAAWNEPDVTTRAELIESAWATDGRYVDPLLEADGHGAISEMVSAVQSQYPGQRFRRLSGVDAHHNQVRFAWELSGDAGDVTVRGIDIGELADDGRLVRITGFFGELPE
jgi:SnoaL-like domain